MKTKLMLLAAAFGLMVVSVHAATITIDFENNSVTGGTLVLTEPGSGSTSDFEGDRFDELTSAGFEIQSIAGPSGPFTLGITATALSDDLNVTGSGLQDGPSGYDQAGEGTSFVFDRDVTVTELDWVSFTSAGSDSVTLSNGGSSLGTFSEGSTSGGIDFSDTNPSTMNIQVNAGDAFEIAYAGGDFFLGQMTVTAIPEPSSIIMVAVTGLAAFGILRRKRK